MPSQWLGLVNLSSFSGPHALAPDPQLMMFRMMMPDNNWFWSLKHGLGVWLKYHYTGCANDSRCVTTKELAQRCKNKSITMVAVQYISRQMLKRLEWWRLGYGRIEGWWDYHRRGGTFIKIRKLTSSTNVEKRVTWGCERPVNMIDDQNPDHRVFIQNLILSIHNWIWTEFKDIL